MTRRRPDRPPRLVGPVAMAAATAAQWILHTLRPSAPFIPFSVADWFIRHVPGRLATEAIDALGHHAQQLLAIASILSALAAGLVARTRRPWPLGAVVAAGALALSRLDPRHPPWTETGLSATVAGVAAAATVAVLGRSIGPATGPDVQRRRLLTATGSLVVAFAFGTTLARRIAGTAPAAAVRADRRRHGTADHGFDAISGLSPAISTRDDHYTVDISLDDPTLTSADWHLQLDGLLDRPAHYTLSDLRAMPTVERIVTLSCISNPVGGALVGNAAWTGITLRSLTELVRPRSAATWLVVRAADRYHEAFALDTLNPDDTMIAIAMNGLTLPRAHGFPARLLVPGRYGVKNVKWLTGLTFTDTPEDGYWTKRGWSRDATVATESRIDTPANHANLAGPITVAGIAWAGDRRIDQVQLSTDDGQTWTSTHLEPELDPLSWRRWRTQLDLPPGLHTIMVRATDHTGTAQTADRRLPHPDGATGLHRITVTVV